MRSRRSWSCSTSLRSGASPPKKRRADTARRACAHAPNGDRRRVTVAVARARFSRERCDTSRKPGVAAQTTAQRANLVLGRAAVAAQDGTELFGRDRRQPREEHVGVTSRVGGAPQAAQILAYSRRRPSRQHLTERAQHRLGATCRDSQHTDGLSVVLRCVGHSHQTIENIVELLLDRPGRRNAHALVRSGHKPFRAFASDIPWRSIDHVRGPSSWSPQTDELRADVGVVDSRARCRFDGQLGESTGRSRASHARESFDEGTDRRIVTDDERAGHIGRERLHHRADRRDPAVVECRLGVHRPCEPHRTRDERGGVGGAPRRRADDEIEHAVVRPAADRRAARRRARPSFVSGRSSSATSPPRSASAWRSKKSESSPGFDHLAPDRRAANGQRTRRRASRRTETRSTHLGRDGAPHLEYRVSARPSNSWRPPSGGGEQPAPRVTAVHRKRDRPLFPSPGKKGPVPFFCYGRGMAVRFVDEPARETRVLAETQVLGRRRRSGRRRRGGGGGARRRGHHARREIRRARRVGDGRARRVAADSRRRSRPTSDRRALPRDRRSTRRTRRSIPSVEHRMGSRRRRARRARPSMGARVGRASAPRALFGRLRPRRHALRARRRLSRERRSPLAALTRLRGLARRRSTSRRHVPEQVGALRDPRRRRHRRDGRRRRVLLRGLAFRAGARHPLVVVPHGRHRRRRARHRRRRLVLSHGRIGASAISVGRHGEDDGHDRRHRPRGPHPRANRVSAPGHGNGRGSARGASFVLARPRLRDRRATSASPRVAV